MGLNGSPCGGGLAKVFDGRAAEMRVIPADKAYYSRVTLCWESMEVTRVWGWNLPNKEVYSCEINLHKFSRFETHPLLGKWL